MLRSEEKHELHQKLVDAVSRHIGYRSNFTPSAQAYDFAVGYIELNNIVLSIAVVNYMNVSRVSKKPIIHPSLVTLTLANII